MMRWPEMDEFVKKLEWLDFNAQMSDFNDRYLFN